MRHALYLAFLAVLFLAGCALRTTPGAQDKTFSGMSDEERTRMCTRLYRDEKTACREGLQDENASRSFECLDARMKLDRFCVSPR